jgi:hypothetical protein
LFGSDISWLFVAINAMDRTLHRWTGYHVLVPFAWRGMQQKALAVKAPPELNSEPDETAHAVALFLGDMDRSVVGVSATGRLLINNLVLGMLDLRCVHPQRHNGFEVHTSTARHTHTHTHTPTHTAACMDTHRHVRMV